MDRIALVRGARLSLLLDGVRKPLRCGPEALRRSIPSRARQLLAKPTPPYSCRMNDDRPVRGELQQEIMRVLWARQSASVEEVRDAIPESRRGGYNSVQTVLNRLVDRGLVKRIRSGRAYVYSAAVSEADYLSTSMNNLLSGASAGARQAALSSLAESLPEAEFEAVRKQFARKRG